jgi:uncharacterized protein with von Willebrand factor type A (vWA) domain
MVTLLQAVGLEWITPKYICFNVCYNEQGSRTNYVRSSIPHCMLEITTKYNCNKLIVFMKQRPS